MIPLRPLLHALAIVAFCAQNARAGELALYLGVEPSDEAAAEVAALLSRLEPPAALAEPPVHLADALGEVTVFGGEIRTCEAEPVDRAAYTDLLVRARVAVDDVRFDEAEALLGQLEAARPCLSEVVPPAELAELFFRRGILAFYRGDPPAARDAFRDAVAVDPDFPWDPDYPPTAQQEFGAAVIEVGRSLPAIVVSFVGDDGQVLVDGGAVGEIPPGRHLLQWERPGRVTTFEVTGGDGVVTHLVSRQALLAPDEALARLAPTLVRVARDPGATGPEYLVVLGDAPLVWRVEGDVATAVQVPSIPDPVEIPQARIPPVGPILMATGAAVAVVGGVLTAVGRKGAADHSEAIEDLATPEDDLPGLFDEFERSRDTAYLGVALLAAGGGCVALSIPVTVITTRKARVQASVVAVPPVAGAEAWLAVGVTIR